MSETIEDTFKFEAQVQTANTLKTVVADSQEALDAAVKAALAEAPVVSPDIDDPEHANIHADEAAATVKKLAEKRRKR